MIQLNVDKHAHMYICILQNTIKCIHMYVYVCIPNMAIATILSFILLFYSQPTVKFSEHFGRFLMPYAYRLTVYTNQIMFYLFIKLYLNKSYFQFMMILQFLLFKHLEKIYCGYMEFFEHPQLILVQNRSIGLPDNCRQSSDKSWDKEQFINCR